MQVWGQASLFRYWTMGVVQVWGCGGVWGQASLFRYWTVILERRVGSKITWHSGGWGQASLLDYHSGSK